MNQKTEPSAGRNVGVADGAASNDTGCGIECDHRGIRRAPRDGHRPVPRIARISATASFLKLRNEGALHTDGRIPRDDPEDGDARTGAWGTTVRHREQADKTA